MVQDHRDKQIELALYDKGIYNNAYYQLPHDPELVIRVKLDYKEIHVKTTVPWNQNIRFHYDPILTKLKTKYGIYYPSYSGDQYDTPGQYYATYTQRFKNNDDLITCLEKMEIVNFNDNIKG